MRVSVTSHFKRLNMSLVWPLSSSRLCRQPRLTLWFEYTRLSSSGSSLPHMHTRMHTRTQTHANAGSVRWKSSWREEGRGVCRWETQRALLWTPSPALPRAAACRAAGLAHSLAAMKLMWGLTRGKRGRLLLNSVMSWTNVGCKGKRGQVRVAFPLMSDVFSLFCSVCSLEDKALPKLQLLLIAKIATCTLFPPFVLPNLAEAPTNVVSVPVSARCCKLFLPWAKCQPPKIKQRITATGMRTPHLIWDGVCFNKSHEKGQKQTKCYTVSQYFPVCGTGPRKA